MSDKSISQQIVELLYNNQRPMDVDELFTAIGGIKKTVHTKCLELKQNGFLKKEEDKPNTFSLEEGVTPDSFKKKSTGVQDESAGSPPPLPDKPELPKPKGTVLDQRNMFMSHMVGIGVTPKDAIPTITDIFFSGDINSLAWLNQVLMKEAAGFVTPDKRKLMLSWWAHTRSLPYKEEEFPLAAEETAKSGKEKPKEKPKGTLWDPGIGWRIDVDTDGRWKPLPGGPYEYDEAVEKAKERAAIEAFGKGKVAPPSEDGEEDEEEAPAGKGGKKKGFSVYDFMQMMWKDVMDSRKHKDDDETPLVASLRTDLNRALEKIDELKQDREEQRLASIEANLAQLASYNPWDDPERVAVMRQRLGIQTSPITDSSPAVQVFKDSTDKLDKNVGRLIGFLEQSVLQQGDIKLEKTRTPEEREAKADQLLKEAGSRDRSRELGKRVFGH